MVMSNLSICKISAVHLQKTETDKNSYYSCMLHVNNKHYFTAAMCICGVKIARRSVESTLECSCPSSIASLSEIHIFII